MRVWIATGLSLLCLHFGFGDLHEEMRREAEAVQSNQPQFDLQKQAKDLQSSLISEEHRAELDKLQSSDSPMKKELEGKGAIDPEFAPIFEQHKTRDLYVDKDDPLFADGDLITDASEKMVGIEGRVDPNDLESDSSDEIIVSCEQAGSPLPIVLTRALHVDVKHIPAKKEKRSWCKGHSEEFASHFWRENAKRDKGNLENRFGKDASIKDFKIEITGGNFGGDYHVKGSWSHNEQGVASGACSSFATKEVILQEERWEETDRWEWENPRAARQVSANSSECIFREFLEPRVESSSSGEERGLTKTIGNRAIRRPHWKERLVYLVAPACPDPEKDCKHINPHRCRLIENSKKCAQTSPEGECLLWSKQFACSKRTRKAENSFSFGDAPPIYCLDGKCQENEYEPNTNFSDVATKLMLFSEMKQDLEKNRTPDATTAQVFPGKSYNCCVSRWEKGLYDCCTRLTGGVMKAHLAKCSEEEVLLSELKDEGRCHFVGEREEQLAGVLWTTRTRKVYCCFRSKLMRLLQTQARQQLGIDWGTADSPNCRGLSPGEIQQVNFDQIDLSGAIDVERVDQKALEKKLKSFQDRLGDVEASVRENTKTIHEALIDDN